MNIKAKNIKVNKIKKQMKAKRFSSINVFKKN